MTGQYDYGLRRSNSSCRIYFVGLTRGLFTLLIVQHLSDVIIGCESAFVDFFRYDLRAKVTKDCLCGVEALVYSLIGIQFVGRSNQARAKWRVICFG